MDPLNIKLADTFLEVLCDDRGFSSFLSSELDSFRVPAPVDSCGNGDSTHITIDLRWAESSIISEVSPGEHKFRLPGKVELVIEIVETPESSTLGMSAFLGSPDDEAALNFLYSFILNYSLNHCLQRRNRERPVHYLIVHACGVVLDGCAYLFAGSSGVGKTTVAHELLEDGSATVLGDDMIILTQDGNNGWTAYSSPLGGDIERSRIMNVSAPLEAVFLLSQGQETLCRPLEATHAAAALISSVVPAYPLRFTARQQLSDYDRESLDLLIGDAAMLADEVRCFSLQLPPEHRPWREIFNIDRDKGTL